MEKYLDLKNDKDYTKIKEASKIINNFRNKFLFSY